MAKRTAPTEGRSDARDERLDSIAQTVRRTYNTVEDMTQSFIREAILQGVYAPGERLNQDSIAATLGVSRMPVRASLRQLEGEGLLQILPHRGATVSVLRAEEIAEIYELRILLESYLLEHAMPHLTPEVLKRLEESVKALEDEPELGPRFERRKIFYNELYALADRPRALAEANNLRLSVGRYLLLQRVDEHRSHVELLRHLRKGNLDGARKWLVTHLGHVSERLQKMVAAEESGNP